LVYSELDIVDLMELAQTCRTIRESVLHHCHNINKLLEPFFESEDTIEGFRKIQDETEALISGSTALRFFQRKEYAGQDLDLYVEARYAPAVAWFLEKAGYQFYKRENQASSWRAQLMHPRNLDEELEAGEPDVGPYLGRGIQDVLAFISDLKMFLWIRGNRYR